MNSAPFNLCELFVSVQGEGSYLGQPSIFVRSSGCNLRCRWGNTLCDTDYTSWTPEQDLRDVAAVLTQVKALRGKNPAVSHVVVTGGEPMCQPSIAELLQALANEGLFITLETNGTVPSPLTLPISLVSLSPKLASSIPVGSEFEQMHRKTRINVEALRYWTENYTCQFKFVVFSEEDEQEIREILSQLPEVKPEQVFLMPEGINMEQLRDHARHCVRISIKNGWRYTPRAHIEIFGNQRGT